MNQFFALKYEKYLKLKSWLRKYDAAEKNDNSRVQ
ncbi:hypothetical protein DFP97_10595 [Paenibacillus prosopidis]|uniref:Uncharacterized protein n=1 Tax=Paenibacillus prosopidis TaxID=630520 RepID=A0A368W436_9BACL|nr:hypothetical protein DFP97_10595 [Paenibacillus prosopidis]